MQCLNPNEIRCLSKSNGHRTDDVVYIKSCGGIVEKLIADDYLVVGTKEQSLSHSDMNIIRKLIKDKELKAGGKKVDLVQRIFENYTKVEIESIDIPQRFVLTAKGEQIVCENAALLLYFNSLGSTGILEPEKIIDAQKIHRNEDAVDILIDLLSEKIDCTKNIGQKRAYTAHLIDLYKMKYDETLVSQLLEEKVQKMDKVWEKERTKQDRRQDSILGIVFKDRKRLQQQAIESRGTNIEKEQAESALRDAVKMVNEDFIETLKTNIYQVAPRSKKKINSMGNEDFTTILAKHLGMLDAEERGEAERIIAKRIECWTSSEQTPLSLRETILLDLQAMIKSCNYHRKKK